MCAILVNASTGYLVLNCRLRPVAVIDDSDDGNGLQNGNIFDNATIRKENNLLLALMILKAFLGGIKSHIMTVIPSLWARHKKASWVYLFFLITKSIKLFKLVLLPNTTKRVLRDRYLQMASGTSFVRLSVRSHSL